MAEPRIDRSYKSLAPALAFALWHGICAARNDNLSISLFEGFRSKERQTFLYSKGRTTPGKIVTRATWERSWHSYGVAADIAFRNSEGTWYWPEEDEPWERAAEHLKKHGLFWGGDWKSFKDKPHFQLGNLPTSPGQGHVTLLTKGGPHAVWEFFGVQNLRILDSGVYGGT